MLKEDIQNNEWTEGKPMLRKSKRNAGKGKIKLINYMKDKKKRVNVILGKEKKIL